MKEIKRMNEFIEQYHQLQPMLKRITKGSYEHLIIKLGKEYERVSKHPHPKEYLELSD